MDVNIFAIAALLIVGIYLIKLGSRCMEGSMDIKVHHALPDITDTLHKVSLVLIVMGLIAVLIGATPLLMLMFQYLINLLN